MPSAVFFGSSRINVPGSYSVLDASSLAGLSPSATGIVALLGQSQGGVPLSVDPQYSDMTTPEGVRQAFRDGDLRDAGQFAFDPSGDDAIGGAQRLVCVKVNPATQSLGALFDLEGSPAVTVTSDDYGVYTQGIGVEVLAGTLQGKQVDVLLEGTAETMDNLGGTDVFDVQIPAIAPWLAVTGRVTARAWEAKAVGGAEALVIAPTAVAPTLVSTQAGDTMQATVYGVDGSGVAQSVTLTLTGTTPATLGTALKQVTGVTIASIPAGQITVSHSGTPVLILAGRRTAAGFIPVRSGAVLTGRPIYVWATQTAAPVASGKVVLRGVDVNNSPLTEVVQLNGGTAAQLQGAWQRIDSMETGNVVKTQFVFIAALATDTTFEINDACVLTSPGANAANGPFVKTATTISIASSSSLDTSIAITVYGLNASLAEASETISTNGSNGTTPVTTVGTYALITGISFASMAVGTVTFTYGGGFSGASAIAVPPATSSYGNSTFTNTARLSVPSGQSVFVSSDTDATTDADRYVVIDGVDATGASLGDVVRLQGRTRKVLANAYAFITAIRYLGAPGCSVYVATARPGAAVTATQAPLVSTLCDRISRQPGSAVTIVAPDVAAMNTTDLDAAPSSILSGGSAAPFYADLYRLISGVNSTSQMVTLTRSPLAARTLGNMASPAYLAGGVEGTTTITQWQQAFAALATRRVNEVVPLSQDPAVHALLRSHLISRAGILRSEANGYVGIGTTAGAGETRSNIKTQIRNLNTRHISAVSQSIQRNDPDTGVATWYAPYMLAAHAAGMQAGAPIGEPLTRKTPNVLDIANDVSWSPVNDASEMIDSGLMFAQKRDGEGITFVRSITTYLTDDNVVFSEMSANAAANYAVYELRRQLDQKTGTRGLSGSAAAIKGLAQQILEDLQGRDVIVAFRSITVEQVADVFSVSVEMAPVLPINFVLTTVHLVAVRVAA